MSLLEIEAEDWSDADESLWAKADQDDFFSVDWHDKEEQLIPHHDSDALQKPAHCSTVPEDTDVISIFGQAPFQMFIRSHYMCVTDLTQQLWCEQHMLYAVMGIEPQPPEPLEGEVQVPVPLKTADRPEVKAGKSIHLVRELDVHDVVSVKITSRADKWAVNILNLLSSVRGFLSGVAVAREIPIFGDPFGTGDLFFGIIDELRLNVDTYQMHLSELKTRKTHRLPGKAQKTQHSFQVQLYKRLWDNFVKGSFCVDPFLAKLDLNSEADQPLSDHIISTMDTTTEHPSTLRQLLSHTFSAAQALVCISSISIEYVHQDTGLPIGEEEVEDNADWIEQTFRSCMAFWHGEREAVGVAIEEAWKCHSCEYASICEWRRQKSVECQQKNALQKR